jgi:hypothetical protein
MHCLYMEYVVMHVIVVYVLRMLVYHLTQPTCSNTSNAYHILNIGSIKPPHKSV